MRMGNMTTSCELNTEFWIFFSEYEESGLLETDDVSELFRLVCYNAYHQYEHKQSKNKDDK